MKRFFCFAFLLGIFMYCQAQILKPQCYFVNQFISTTYYTCEDYDDWVLVFEDDFDGNDLDYSKWENSYPWGRNLYCNPEVQYYSDDENFEFDNGYLRLIAKEESKYERIDPNKGDTEYLYCLGEFETVNKINFYYTSGMIFSKQQFQYGIFEIKCKIPKIRRTWPAFWLYGACGQEIDIFEFLSTDPDSIEASEDVRLSYHRKSDCEEEDVDALLCMYDYDTDIDMSTTYHTYSVEWDEHYLTWRIDGTAVLIRSRWWNTLGQDTKLCGAIPSAMYKKDIIYPLDDEPMNIIANLAIKDNPTADFPTEMKIDYIRVYQRINTSSTVSICSNSDINGSTVAGKEITVGGSGCSISIEDGEFLDLVATDGITIESNFEVEAGAIFSASIDSQ